MVLINKDDHFLIYLTKDIALYNLSIMLRIKTIWLVWKVGSKSNLSEKVGKTEKDPDAEICTTTGVQLI